MRRTLLFLFIICSFLSNAQIMLCTADGRTCKANCTFCTEDNTSPGPYRTSTVNVTVPAGQYLNIVDFTCDGSGPYLDGGDDLFIDGIEFTGRQGCFQNGSNSSKSIVISLRADRSDECITYEVSSSPSGSCTFLPIELGYFNAEVKDDFVEVNWQTTLELNNDYMEVQRSRTGKDFTTVSRITGAGTTDEPQNYSFTDKEPFPGKSYYRLKQVDYDGAYEIHQTAIVDRKTTDWEIQTLPTNVHNYFTLVSSQSFPPGTTYNIYTTNGQLVQRGTVDERTETMELNVTNLVSGLYYLRLQSSMGNTFTTFVKQ